MTVEHKVLLTDLQNKRLLRLAAVLQTTPQTVFRQALALIEKVVEAEQDNLDLAVVDENDVVLRYIRVLPE